MKKTGRKNSFPLYLFLIDSMSIIVPILVGTGLFIVFVLQRFHGFERLNERIVRKFLDTLFFKQITFFILTFFSGILCSLALYFGKPESRDSLLLNSPANPKLHFLFKTFVFQNFHFLFILISVIFICLFLKINVITYSPLLIRTSLSIFIINLAPFLFYQSLVLLINNRMFSLLSIEFINVFFIFSLDPLYKSEHYKNLVFFIPEILFYRNKLVLPPRFNTFWIAAGCLLFILNIFLYEKRIKKF